MTCNQPIPARGDYDHVTKCGQIAAVENGAPGAIVRTEEAITTAETAARRARQSPQHENTMAASEAAEAANRAAEVVEEIARQARAQ